MGNFCVATSQSWGSNPDRSPVAQWLNMRISPASRLPGLCLPASASRGPFKTRARPGVGGKPRAAGEVFRNHNTGPNSPPFKTLARAGVGGKPRAAGEVFRNHNAGPNSPLFKTLGRPGVGRKPRAAGKVFRNHNTGPNSPPFKTPARPGVGGKPRAAGRFSEITILAGHEVTSIPVGGLVAKWLGEEGGASDV